MPAFKFTCSISHAYHSWIMSDRLSCMSFMYSKAILSVRDRKRLNADVCPADLNMALQVRLGHHLKELEKNFYGSSMAYDQVPVHPLLCCASNSHAVCKDNLLHYLYWTLLSASPTCFQHSTGKWHLMANLAHWNFYRAPGHEQA